MSIENTQDPGSIELAAMLLLATRDADAVIGAQQKAGQRQLVRSDQLPTDLNGDQQAAFEAVGFVFGDPTPGDPLFRAVTLPDGWRKEPSDHDMWSYIVDRLGRRRVRVFYKAAFYDRSAHMNLATVEGYVAACQSHGRDIVTDDTWATRAAVAEAARRLAEHAQERADSWARIAERRGRDEMTAKYVAEYTAERDRYRVIAAEYGA